MIYRTMAAPRGRSLAAITWTAALAAALCVATGTMTLAQQPAEPAAPAAKPKPTVRKPAVKPAAPPAAQAVPGPEGQPGQGGPQLSGGEQMKFIYSHWVKFCRKDQDTDNKQVCFTGSEARLDTGMVVGNVVLIEPEGGPKVIRISVPITVQLQPGTRMIIDQGKEEGETLSAPFMFCGPQAPLCFSQYEASPDTVAKLKKSQMVTIQAVPLNAHQAISIPLPTAADFTKAYDGPPTDPKVFAEQQQKLQEELQKRADEARKKLESQQQGAPGAAAATAPAPQAPKPQ
jgi:invasion protein IalB